MRYLPHIAAVAVAILLVVALLDGVGVAVTVIVTALILGLPLFALLFAASAVVLLFVDVDVPLSERLFRPRIMSGLLCLAVVTIAASLPWMLALVDDVGTTRLLVWVSIALLAGLTFVAVRPMPFGWAFVISPSLLLLCAWVAVLSLSVAKHAGWQDLTWEGVPEDADSGLVGDGFGLALIFIFTSTLALIAGPVIGLLSQIGKRRTPASS